MVSILKKYLNKTIVQLKVPCTIVFCFCTLFANSQFIPSERSVEKTQNKIQELFGSEVVTTPLDINSNYYKVLSNDSVIAYYCIEQAPSKHHFFEFLVVYNPYIKIKDVNVLVYREDYGFEIKSKRWLKQFSTRKISTVQAISGATISVNSLKKHVERLTENLKNSVL